VKLLPPDTRERIELAARWLARKENYQWLDFGNGRQVLTPALIEIAVQRDTNLIRLYAAGADDTPVGIVGLSNVERSFKTARLWGVAGEKSAAEAAWMGLAWSSMLNLAFAELGLHAVHTWVVEGNPLLRTVQALNFRFIGRQRQCHCIDGRPYDRLLFDLLAGEHRKVEGRRSEQAARPSARRPAVRGLGAR
jgi:RimJ/RimL family protein N-acetyltransferase